MLFYLVKSTAILAILLLFYKLFLERESIHKFKRHFLLASILVAIIIPAITFTTYIEVTPLPLPILDGHVTNVQLTEDPSIDYTASVLWIIYALGVLVFGIRFMYNIAQIFIRINRSEKLRKDSFIYVLLNNLQIPHTFFNYLFFDKNTYKAQSIPKEVELHEQTHATQLHSLDILLIELLHVVFWFNPIIYLLKHMVKLNHEFIADEAVLKSGVAIKNYQHILLNYSNIHKNYPIANAINYSLIKKRLIIMKTRTSKKVLWIRSILLLPLLAMLVYGFGEKKLVQTVTTTEYNTKDSTKAGYVNPSELTFIKISLSDDGIILNNTKTVSLENLTEEIKKIIDPSKAYGAIIEASDIDMGSVIDIKSELSKLGISYFKKDISHNLIQEDSIKSNITRQQVIQYNRRWANNTPEFYYTKQTFWIEDKSGIKVAKKYYNLSELDKKKWLEFPNQNYSEKQISKNEYEKLLDESLYVVWINGFLVNNSELKKYNRTQFVTYSHNNISELTGLNQKYHYNLITEQAYKMISKNQERATQEQIAVYNKLAKQYNLMTKENKIVRSEEVEQMKYIYNLMSDQQKSKAEPSPFPSLALPYSIPTKTQKTKLHEDKRDTIPPPPPPVPSLNAIEKGSEKLQDTYKKYSKSAEKYAESVRKYNGTEEGRSKLYHQYKEVMKLYDEFKALAEKENIIAPPPLPSIPAKKSASKKVGYISKDGKTLYYSKSKDIVEYYNRYGMSVDKEGNPIKV
ncbi:MAG: hypothetical protein KDC74_06505 [Flavobacteriaceae bacterium]|nr:hypothetical protein [Flavobacteriaceae bacterium]